MAQQLRSKGFRKLQTSLQAKAKAEPAFRFYSLWDKVCRADVLEEAYRACRRNDGAPGCDGMTFDQIAAHGQDRWLEELRQELRAGEYRPQPLLRVWIPKSNGGQRPLGIPCIRDRVVEMAALLVLGPIFEADLLRNQYGFRPGMDAKMAVRQAFWHVSDHGRSEVVDADLSDYFSSIPHGPLMRCVSRRVADGTLLSVIKRWLTAPVIERDKRTTRCTTEAKDRHRGTPQGSPISPLLANLYFRRFLLAWERFGHRKQLDAHVVNYADDLVICCRPGNGSAALATMRQLMTRLGLTVNEAKTATGATARGELRLPRLQHRSILRQRRGALYRHAPVPEGCPAPAPASPRRDDAAQACRRAQNYGWPPSIGSSAAGLSISTKGRFFRPTSWCAGMCNGVFNDGWCDAADKRAPDTASIRTSISTRRSASMPCRAAVPTCRARRLDDAGESRMREIVRRAKRRVESLSQTGEAGRNASGSTV